MYSWESPIFSVIHTSFQCVLLCSPSPHPCPRTACTLTPPYARKSSLMYYICDYFDNKDHSMNIAFSPICICRETAPKIRRSLNATRLLKRPEEFSKMRCSVIADLPNPSLAQFQASVSVHSGVDKSDLKLVRTTNSLIFHMFIPSSVSAP